MLELDPWIAKALSSKPPQPVRAETLSTFRAASNKPSPPPPPGVERRDYIIDPEHAVAVRSTVRPGPSAGSHRRLGGRAGHDPMPPTQQKSGLIPMASPSSAYPEVAVCAWSAMRAFVAAHDRRTELQEALGLGRGLGRVKVLVLLTGGPMTLRDIAEANRVDAPMPPSSSTSSSAAGWWSAPPTRMTTGASSCS